VDAIELSSSLEFSRALLGPCSVDASTPEWKQAEADGWDMSLVRDALRGDVHRRVWQHHAALSMAESLRATYLEQYGEPRGAA
jgi:hypothetical protein